MTPPRDANEEQVRQAGASSVVPTKAVFSHLPPSEETSDSTSDRCFAGTRGGVYLDNKEN